MWARLLLAAVLAQSAREVWAANWDVTPSLSLRQTYSDNISLAPDDLAQSEWVTQLIPAVNVSADGSKLRFSLNYAPALTYYAENTQENQIFQRGNALVNLELAEDFFFLDASSTVDQYNVSLQGPLTGNNVNTTGNLATVGTASLSPYIRHRFGASAEVLARYTYSKWRSDKQPELNNTAHSVDLRLNSGPAFSLLTWDLEYRGEQLLYDDPLQAEADTDSQVVLARARRVVTPTIGLLVRAGYEYYTFNDFKPDSNGPAWGGGISWTPSPRTRLNAVVGRRFYGNAYDLDFFHRTRLMVIGASYDQRIITTRADFFIPVTGSTANYLDQLYSTSITDPVARRKAVEALSNKFGIPQSLNAPVNYSATQLFLEKRWLASITAQGVNNIVIANLFQTDRNAIVGDVLLPGIIDANNNTLQTGTSLSWNWSMTARDTLNQIASFSRVEFPGTGRKDDLAVYSIGVTRQFRPALVGSLRYGWQQNSSTDAGSDYSENSVVITIRMEF